MPNKGIASWRIDSGFINISDKNLKIAFSQRLGTKDEDVDSDRSYFNLGVFVRKTNKMYEPLKKYIDENTKEEWVSKPYGESLRPYGESLRFDGDIGFAIEDINPSFYKDEKGVIITSYWATSYNHILCKIMKEKEYRLLKRERILVPCYVPCNLIEEYKLEKVTANKPEKEDDYFPKDKIPKDDIPF